MSMGDLSIFYVGKFLNYKFNLFIKKDYLG
jgi:hypothetical protein